MAAIEKPFCDKHNVEKLKDKNNKNHCKFCHAERVKRYRHENKEVVLEKTREWRESNREQAREYTRKYRREKTEQYIHAKLMNKFGISYEDYQSMLVYSNYKCEICLKEEVRIIRGKKVRLGVDHCHESKKIRGILCFKCNVLLGNCNDDIQILQSAIEYLKKHKDNPDGASSS